jgi:large subunit ribosomal protein L30e
VIEMANLAGDIRLAVESGDAAIGTREVLRAVMSSEAKLIIVSSTMDKSAMDDIRHLAGISETRIIVYKSDPTALGTVCGKPYQVSAIAIIDPGNSKILEEEY